MSWYSVGIAWVVLGLIEVCAIEVAARSSNVDSPLSQGSPLSSIGFTLALIVAAPFVFLFAVGVYVQMLWQGRIPITNQIWWRARATKLMTSPIHVRLGKRFSFK